MKKAHSFMGFSAYMVPTIGVNSRKLIKSLNRK